VLDDGQPVTSDQLDGVLVRSRGWIQSNDWQSEDHDYMSGETQSALLGWLWSLSCPVVGRLPASLWYRPLTTITYWQPLLARCGLDAPEALVTNLAPESRAFRDRLGGTAIYAPFSSPARYVLATEDDWNGVEAIQRRAPVCLVRPHGTGQSLCLIGERAIWNGDPPVEAAEVELGLGRFAAAAELNFVQFTISRSEDRLQVVDVDPQPRLEQFCEGARQGIVAAAIEFLTKGARKTAAAWLA
jgi:hypothetical protein